MTAPVPNEALKARTARFVRVVTLLLVFLILSRPPADPDMWWHLSAGKEMLARGEILTHDVFSYTRAGATWVNAFWLSDLAMALIHRYGGFFALALTVALWGVLTLNLLYARQAGPPLLRAAVTLLAALTLSPFWTPRPQLASFFLLAVLDGWVARRDGLSPRARWTLPLLFVLWANLHGGFIWGILLLIAEAVGAAGDYLLSPGEADPSLLRRARDLALVTLLSWLAVLLNPNGAALWRLPFQQVSVSLEIQEWHSPDFHRLDLHFMLWMLFLYVVALGFSGRRPRLGEMFKVLGFAYLAFYAVRAVAPYALVLAPPLAHHLSGALERWGDSPLGRRLDDLMRGKAARPLPERVSRVINLSAVALLLAMALLRLYAQSLPQVVEKDYPGRAVTWIQENHPPGRLFNSYNWGGYLLWNLPEYPVFVDGRADLYGEAILDQWWDVVQAKEGGWEVLDRWNVRLVLLEPHWPIVRELPERGWEVLYQDDVSVVFGR
ncbi:MAG: hypothetical protein D6770_01750 [Anaerolineae bacterium]|nr:MAG: hypothetical protein D6770_01750 [Anaerolineae bacterium]